MSDAGPPGRRQWMCLSCGYIYDEAQGDPARGHPPGTLFEDLPLSWRCPDCGSDKGDFDLVVD